MDTVGDLVLAIQRLKDSIIHRGIARREEIVGCDEREVSWLEEKLGASVPLAYKLFLLSMGKAAGGLMVGTDFFFGRISEHRQWFLEAVAECGDQVSLAEDSIVFMSHQGVVFMVFRSSEGDNPPVYRYVQNTNELIKISDTFTDFVEMCISAEATMHQEREDFRARSRASKP